MRHRHSIEHRYSASYVGANKGKPTPIRHSDEEVGQTHMNRIIKITVLAVVAVLATAAVANASVTANADGTSIGKGDVQTALGYHNDAAFQADAQAGKITFSYGSDVTQMIADIKCSAANIMGPDDPFDTAHNVVSSTVTPHGANVTALKNNQGKVTGYTATGITSGTPA